MSIIIFFFGLFVGLVLGFIFTLFFIFHIMNENNIKLSIIKE